MSRVIIVIIIMVIMLLCYYAITVDNRNVRRDLVKIVTGRTQMAAWSDLLRGEIFCGTH